MTWPDDFINKIINADCLEVMKQMPDKCVDLVLTDPPYFGIKGEFDFKWVGFEDFLGEVEKWAIEIKRVMKEKGTLYWFVDEKRGAYIQIILDKYFGLLNNLVWWKYNLRGGAFGSSGGDLIRSFPICTERILVYSNDVYNLTQCVYSTRDYIRSEIIRAKGKIVLKEVNQALGTADNGGGVASACLSLNKSEPAMFTEERYQKLREWLNGTQEYEYLRKEYEYLRKEYEDLRRPFNNHRGLTEVLKFDTETNHKFGHETVKPISLIGALMEVSSNPNDLILDPFLGSGTTAVAAKQLGRNYIGIEISEKYCKIAEDRLRQEVLF